MELQIVTLLLVAYWCHGWYMNFSAGIFIREKTKVLPVIRLSGAAITIGANLLLIPVYGMMGSAAATLISYFSMALMLYFQSTKVYHVNYQMTRAFAMMVLTIGCLFAVPYLQQWTGGEWISRIIMLGLGTIGLTLFSLPSSER